MANIRFKGGNASERLDLTTVKQGDMLQTRHDPNGSEDSDKGIPFGLCQATPVFECTTAGATASKVASLISDETFPDFVLYNGRQIMVHFTHGNAVDSPTLNVGGVAYPIRLQNQKSTVVIGEGCWGDDVWLSFMFVSDGTNSYWILLGHNIAKQRSDATSGYTIYADGTFNQWWEKNISPSFSQWGNIYESQYFYFTTSMGRLVLERSITLKQVSTGSYWIDYNINNSQFGLCRATSVGTTVNITYSEFVKGII